MRLLLLCLAATPLLAQPTPHTPRGPAAHPEALAWQRYLAQSKAALGTINSQPAASLPPLPDGTSDLAFSEFFGPIGDRGLEYSDKLRALAGRRVRLVGYMVREPERAAGLFRFAAFPVTVEANGLCVSDDTPPMTVHVITGSSAEKTPWQPGKLVLIGTLELGARAESDGHNSIFRLVLDAPAANTATPASPSS